MMEDSEDVRSGWKELLVFVSTLALVILQVTGVIDWGWGWVLAPLWGYVFISVLVHGLYDVYDSTVDFHEERKRKRNGRKSSN